MNLFLFLSFFFIFVEQQHQQTTTRKATCFFSHTAEKVGDDSLMRDATDETDKFGRLINHSRKNANILAQAGTYDGKTIIYIIAKREILPNEEILYDYGERRTDALRDYPCLSK